MAEEVYTVKIDYSLDPKGAVSGLESIGGKLLSVNAAVDLFRKAWDGISLLAAPIAFNSELEQSKIIIGSVASATEGWVGGMARGIEEADVLVKGFIEDAKASVATTADFVNIAQTIAPALLPLGKGMSDVRETTTLAVAAATSMGLDFQLFAQQFGFIISGMAGRENITFMRMFANEFNRAAAEGESFTKIFNEMPIEERLAAVNEKMKLFGQATEFMGESWKGITSTLEDTWDIFSSKLTLPLFEAIKTELLGWNEHIEGSERMLETIAEDYGKKLVEMFHAARDAAKWLVDHKEELIAIAQAWAAMGVASGLGKLGGGISKMAGKGVLAGSRIPVEIVGIAGAAAAVLTASIIGGWTRADVAEEEVASLMRAGEMATTGASASALKSVMATTGFGEEEVRALTELTPKMRHGMKIVLEAGFLDPMADAIEGTLPPAAAKLVEGLKEAGGGVGDLNTTLSNLREIVNTIDKEKMLALWGDIPMADTGLAMEKFGIAARERAKKRVKPEINVVIKQDFKDNANPDRIKVAVVDEIAKLAANPLHARTVTAFG